MEPRAELEQRSEPAPDRERALPRPRRPGEDLEERALTRAVLADEPERRSPGHREVDPAERPLLGVPADAAARRPLDDPRPRVREDPIELPEALGFDDDLPAHRLRP